MKKEPNKELAPVSIIRTETVLSRLPVHRLAKRGNIRVEIKTRNKQGELTFQWKVLHPPGPLAYKVEKLVIDRRIDEALSPEGY